MKFLCANCDGTLVSTDPESEFTREIRCSHCGRNTYVPGALLAPRVVINDFVIKHEIAKGGMGTVYLAHQVTLDRDVALKILMDKFSRHQSYVTNFVKEARAAAKLNHTNIVQAYAVGEENGFHFFAMEFVEGKSIQEILAKQKKMPCELALEIIIQIADALDFAWNKQKMVHRDIKPDNIMMTIDGIAKLADLGLAQLTSDMTDDSADEDVIMGTPYYICPETLLGNPLDNRSDLYSLGATLFHIVTGEFPFTGNSPIEIATRHLEAEPPMPNEINPDISEGVCLIINRLMAKNPDDRYQSGRELNIAITKATGIAVAGISSTEDEPDSWDCACGRTNTIADKKCVGCGVSGYEACPICNGDLLIGAGFCSHCGGDVLEKKRIMFRENDALSDQLEDAVHRQDITAAMEIVEKCNEFARTFSNDRLPKRLQDLLEKFRIAMEQRLDTARQELHLDRAIEAVETLIAAFGREKYSLANEELEVINKDLGEAIFQASMAMSVNCLSQCMDMLNAAEQWRSVGPDGDDRLDAAKAKCHEMLQDRNNTLRLLKVQLGNANFAEAIKSYKKLVGYRTSERLTTVHPSPADTDFDKQVSDLHTSLSSKIDEVFKVWIEDNKWEDLQRTMDLAQKTEIMSANKIEAQKKRIKKETTTRYNAGLDLEKHRKFAQAREAWRHFLAVPQDLCAPQQRQYASAYIDRHRGFVTKKRNQLILRTLIVLFVLWGFTGISTIRTLVMDWKDFAKDLPLLAKFLIPISLQFVGFVAVAWRIKNRRFLKKFENSSDVLPSKLVLIYCLLLIISPFSYAVFTIFGGAIGLVLGNSFLNGGLMKGTVVGLLWCGIDFWRAHGDWRKPTAFGLSLSWCVAAVITFAILGKTLKPPGLFSILTIVHGILFLLIHMIHQQLAAAAAEATEDVNGQS